MVRNKREQYIHSSLHSSLLTGETLQFAGNKKVLFLFCFSRSATNISSATANICLISATIAATPAAEDTAAPTSAPEGIASAADAPLADGK